MTVQGPVKKQQPDGMSHTGSRTRKCGEAWDNLSAEGSGQQKPYNDPATTNRTPVRQLLGSANAETTPAGTRAAAAVRTQRPDAAREGKNG